MGNWEQNEYDLNNYVDIVITTQKSMKYIKFLSIHLSINQIIHL